MGFAQTPGPEGAGGFMGFAQTPGFVLFFVFVRALAEAVDKVFLLFIFTSGSKIDKYKEFQFSSFSL